MFMLSKRKLIYSCIILTIVFSFKQADDYFEISKNMEIFSAVYKTVNSDYVEEVNPGELMKKGIDAMLASLDPYTNYYTESEAEDAMIQRSGEYGGIGCNSRKIGDHIVITGVWKGLPAEKAGLMVGDKILEINGKAFRGKEDDDVGESIKGAPNTKFTMKVERGGNPVTLEITREEIKISNVTYSGMIDKEVGYVRLDHFMAGASTEVKESLVKLKSQGMKKMILDLRENGGGLLHEAVNIVNIFVDMDQLVVTSKGRNTSVYTEYKTLDVPADKEIPLIVLVNEHSASASEIVCGSLQDFDRAVIIGRNTFGKGLVQNVRPLIHRTQMKVTIAKYYIPSGRCIQLLDYGHRNPDGSPVIVPDSLRKKFKTKNGRTVLDGGGVRPDIQVDIAKTPDVVDGLLRSNLIFDFATDYRLKNESIGDINKFEIDDATFESFKSFVSGKEFSFKGKTEKALASLKESLEKDKIADMSAQIKSMEESMNKSRMEAINIYKKEIKDQLRQEIARRYYFETSPFLLSFIHDPDVLKAVEVFSNLTTFQSILGSQQ